MKETKKGASAKPAPINQSNYSRATRFCLSYMITFLVVFVIAHHFELRDLMIASFGNITASMLLLFVTFNKEDTHDQNINAGT